MKRWYMGESRKTASRYCPYCGQQLNGATRMTHGDRITEDPEPKAGDVGVCFTCGRPVVYTETGMRMPDEEEAAVIAKDETIQSLVGAISGWRYGMGPV